MTRSTLAILLASACCSLSLPAQAADPLDAGQGRADTEHGLVWYDAQLLPIDGQGWTDTQDDYDRLPARAKGVVRDPVWSLSKNSAGLCVRFVTAAPEIHVHWKLTSARLALNHMAATGVSGVDLYVKAGEQWRWLAVGRPNAQENTARLVTALPAEAREYRLYLPLYNGVSLLEIGIPATATISPAPDYPAGHSRPIVFWGTSITQGACASRPGMVHTAILGRWFNRPVINLGFSGNGRFEPEMASLLAELDPAVYVLDCLPNLGPDQVAERTEPVVQTLRKAHPQTPILLVEDRTYADAFLIEPRAIRNAGNRREFQAAYARLQQAKVPGLHYLEGANLLGADGDDTVDGSHPSDLGFFRQAVQFRQALRPLLNP